MLRRRKPLTDLFLTLPAMANFALFCALGAAVWMVGARLTRTADQISDHFKLARSTVGLLFLATATSLPEIATTVTAAVEQNAELVLNNLFGGITLQTAMLAIADMWARGALTNYPRKATHALEATLIMILLSMTLVVYQLSGAYSTAWLGFGTVAIGVAYVGAIALLRRYDELNDWVPVDLAQLAEETLPKSADPAARGRDLIRKSLAYCALILVLGVALVGSAEALAEQTGLGSGFVGATLLAGATSMPELTTTLTAVRMGAFTLAISNIFGSNLIMIVLVLPADLLYTPGPIFRDAGPTTPVAIGFGLFVTAIYMVGLIVRRKPRIGPMGVDSALVLAAFFVSVAVYLQIGS